MVVGEEEIEIEVVRVTNPDTVRVKVGGGEGGLVVVGEDVLPKDLVSMGLVEGEREVEEDGEKREMEGQAVMEIKVARGVLVVHLDCKGEAVYLVSDAEGVVEEVREMGEGEGQAVKEIKVARGVLEVHWEFLGEEVNQVFEGQEEEEIEAVDEEEKVPA